jgi:hypothetical protein
MTENHTYNAPSEGAADWHIPLNENFTALDSDVEIRDTEENVSDYPPDAGNKYFATDTGKVFVGDGSEWKLSHVVPDVLVEDSLPSTVPENSIVLIR